MTPSTPEGPAATRCERCAREASKAMGACWRAAGSPMLRDELACYRLGYERLRDALRDVRGFANVMWERSREKFNARIDAALAPEKP